MELTDAAIVSRVLDGDTNAYSLLVERYYDKYARFAVHMLGSREDAEEALQDAFLRAYRSLDRYQDQERFGAWLFRILVNRCRTAAGRRQTRERTIIRHEGLMLAASEEPAVESEAWREELSRAVEQLPSDQREAFLLKHVEELSYEEMAELTGVGVSALKMRVKRACERLRVMLQEAYYV